MTPEFDLFYTAHLEQVEGGEVDHDLDRGGATWFGVSSGFLKSINVTGPISRSQAKQIFFEYFWDATGCQYMDTVAGWAYCDALVNHSPKMAAAIFQAGLGVEADGIVGSKTKAAAKNINKKLFIERYRVARTRYYAQLVKNDPSQVVFLTGWINRLFKLQQAMLAQGLLVSELEKLPWWRPENYSVETKSTAIAGGFFVSVIALFWPEIDTDSINDFLSDPEAIKALALSVVTKLIAQWRGKNKDEL